MRNDSIVIPLKALRRLVVGLIVLILLLVVLLVARANLWRVGLGDLIAPRLAGEIDKSGYQAVFLTGGQVFFGKAQTVGDEYLALSDVFYLSPGSDQQASQLIKRGKELHGPAEPMIIPVREVLFLENLRADSDVATAIAKFHSGQLPLATPPPATVAPASVTPTATRPPTASPTPSPSR